MKKKSIRILLIILLVLIIASGTYAWFLYNTYAEIDVTGSIAFHVLKTGVKSQSMTLDSLAPGATCNYSLTVSNYDEEDIVSKVNMKYGINIKTTTNLPLKYTLNEVIENEEEPINLEESFENNDGVFYRNINSNIEKILVNDTKQTHTYILTVEFPYQYKEISIDENNNIVSNQEDSIVSNEYSDILELIEIVIDAEQIGNDQTESETQ